MDAVRIAISGKSGCGNSTVSRMLAERLGVRLINYTFRTMAADHGMTMDQLAAAAEVDDTWDRTLDRTQTEMAAEGSCVLGSRLAVWLLESADLRVYLAARPEVRAERIHAREGGAPAAVLRATNARDARDRKRYRRLYAIDIDRHEFVDLHIDTERLHPDQIVAMISNAVVGRGLCR